MTSLNPSPLGLRQKIKDRVASVLVWLAVVAPIWGLVLGIDHFLGHDESLDPPGWDCSFLDKAEHTGQCYPAKGWHFEEHPAYGRIAVHDITATEDARQLDIDTAAAWRDLDNKKRQAILDGKATIYDVFEFTPKK